MKAQLVKRQDRFDLYNESDGSKIASTLPNPMGKLSLKNCEAIANGYDLDELAGEYANKELNVELTSKAGNFYGFSSSFKEGFQKALEILGDKKFSENKLLVDFVYFLNDRHFNKYMVDKDEVDLYLESLQQTEWNVIVEMECPECKEYGYISECRNECNKKFTQPKLDAYGCLILKRK